MVDERGDGPSLQAGYLHGQDRPWGRTAPSAVHDSRAHEHRGRECREGHDGERREVRALGRWKGGVRVV